MSSGLEKPFGRGGSEGFVTFVPLAAAVPLRGTITFCDTTELLARVVIETDTLCRLLLALLVGPEDCVVLPLFCAKTCDVHASVKIHQYKLSGCMVGGKICVSNCDDLPAPVSYTHLTLPTKA